MPTTAIRSLVEPKLPELVALRRDLHRHPELSFAEHRTSGIVQDRLNGLGIAFRAGLARPDANTTGTGVVAFLPATENPANAPTVALRADMDALPIAEATGQPHASTTPGVMHACGHDGHTTILLGTAALLASLHHRPNNVVFVFQPAEEGGGGGEKMCRDHALDGSLFADRFPGAQHAARVDRIFGLHGWPTMPLGTVGTRPGPLLAATDDFLITVRGVGGHAAMPHLARDPIVAAAHIITGLQTLASRAVSPLDSLVCTVGRLAGGSANNIIPDAVEIEGTVRTLRDSTRAMARTRLFQIVEGAAASLGCHAHIDWHDGYPSTRNDPDLTHHFFDVARQALGHQRVLELPEPFMGGEDFSYYGQHCPACFYLLGLLPPNADHLTTPLLHQATFDFNDDAIAIGVELMARLATASNA